MAPIDDAIAAIELLEPGEPFLYRAMARKYNTNYTTLAWRHRGCQKSQRAQEASQQKLNPQQEAELVQYINNLTKRALPPTRAMIRNSASHIALEPVSDLWVTRFLTRQGNHLVSKWTSGMDSLRHKADSGAKYKLYFDLLHAKIKQYNVQPKHIYNMGKKGFMIGILGGSKRVFSCQLWEEKQVTATLQDGSREWITLLATICADGTTLPLGLIYAAASGAI
ncbi:hypothetical protein CC86DRAFT_348011 [Ophiobolus disseminans]|uniref:HTH CENPB-type domain-containing protein n=1 Tax=Ophiobolus disseminans TaxID=1469910 RepID=A0A6A7A412_9PLEO|nr:hypothetical protein CC86DRAFT_348011 [Ophiobolus disseminans]